MIGHLKVDKIYLDVLHTRGKGRLPIGFHQSNCNRIRNRPLTLFTLLREPEPFLLSRHAQEDKILELSMRCHIQKVLSYTNY